MNRTLQVLHIEDSELEVELLQRHLTRAGYALISERIETPAALKIALETRQWDAILYGFSMSQFNTSAVQALLNEMGLDIPLLMISGTGGEEIVLKAMHAGAHNYLIKDNLAGLVPAIERQLEEAKNRQAHKLAEASLKASEAELRALFAAMRDVILVLDADGRYIKIAPTDPTYLYKPSTELLGKTLHEVFPKEKADSLLAHLRQALNEGRMQRVEYQMQIGEMEVWFDGSISPMSQNSVIWIARDISERKHLEEQLRQSQKMEAIGQLAGGIAHDFNNLLTIINGYSELLVKRLPVGDPTRRLLNEIKEAGERSAALTRQLLAFSRKEIFTPQILNLNSIIENLEKMLQRIIGEDVQLIVSMDCESGSVRVDPGQIEQVIMNLVVNARDAMPQGGRLTIKTANVDLDAACTREHTGQQPGSYVVLTVSDTGCGMTEGVKQHIFEPFFTTKETGKGTGLGLAVIHGVIKQSKGYIEVYSESDVGTTFEIYLPRVEPSPALDNSVSKIHHDMHGTETILLVEDDIAVRALTHHILVNHGYTVLKASDGNEGLRVAERYTDTIHLLITDVVMPGLSGRQLAERMQSVHPEAKVIYLSGYMDDAVVRHGILQDEVHFLQKPFSIDALILKTSEVLDMD
jgi:two-component system, cell cycle sensor histidine kinase and response regulator CckA